MIDGSAQLLPLVLGEVIEAPDHPPVVRARCRDRFSVLPEDVIDILIPTEQPRTPWSAPVDRLFYLQTAQHRVRVDEA